MENLYVFVFLVKDFATKKTERDYVIAPRFDETRDTLFEKYGSNYQDRCELISFYPYKEEDVK